MQTLEWFCMGILFGLCACRPDVILLQGNLGKGEGEITLNCLQAGGKDTVIIARQQLKNGEFFLKGEAIKLPARVWVKVEEKEITDFILDSESGTYIERTDSGKILVKGSKLQEEYLHLVLFLKEKYDNPIAELENVIYNLERRETLTGDGLTMLQNFRRRLESYKECRFEYLKKLITTNLSHELSLFLMWDEFQDSVVTGKQLLENMHIENKESNIYRILEERLQ